MSETMKLVLLRHGESVWNKENLFTGWMDVDLSDTGRKEAAEAGKLLRQADVEFDVCYTSTLKRAIHTLNLALEQMDRDWLPVIKSWKLNERHYGALQGLNKAETAAKYGEEQVHIWRRSYDVPPPALDPGDPRNPAVLDAYRNVPAQELPLAESLKDTVARVSPYYRQVIWPLIASGERILIAAHGNSLRALMMLLEKLTPEEIMQVNIPTGVPLVYELDNLGGVLDKAYLADDEALRAKTEKVANQGKAQ